MSGRAAARLAKRLGMSVAVYDANTNLELLDSGFSLASADWDRHLLDGIDLVVASPGFSQRSEPVVDVLESGIPIWSEIEFAARHIETPLTAVTGTNGKTTVTEMISAMLRASGIDAPAAGNIGDPLSEFVGGEAAHLVVEVSSFQLRFIESFRPTTAVITNVATDHLDWHGSVHGYREAKRRILENQEPGDVVVYNADDAGSTEIVSGSVAARIPVSVGAPSAGGSGYDDGTLVVAGDAIDWPDLEQIDPTHRLNVALAATAAMQSGATTTAISTAVQRFRPGPHRRQVVGVFDGVTWVNDSKATNPHAALASIRSHDSVVLIAGGLAKGTDIESLAEEPNVRLLIGIGESGEMVSKAAGSRGRYARTLDIAVAMAAGAVEDGETVLLAPGGASFDQFSSYGERGDRFAELVVDYHRVRA